jgi:hypothetical protein
MRRSGDGDRAESECEDGEERAERVPLGEPGHAATLLLASALSITESSPAAREYNRPANGGA